MSHLSRLQISPGTSSHARIRMRGKGIRKVNGIGFGDHYIHLKVRVPNVLSGKQEALVKAYAELETDTPGAINGITVTKGGKMNHDSRFTIHDAIHFHFR